MKLIFVNEVGSGWDDTIMYEFIFGDDELNNVDGYGWDEYPSAGKAHVPDKTYIHAVGRVETSEFKLMSVRDSSTFSVWDAVDGVIALAWEDVSEYDEYPESRLKFFFGDDLNTVKNLLYSRDVIMEVKKIK